MSNIQQVKNDVNDLNDTVKSASLSFTEFFVLTSRLSGLLRRMGLPENIAHAMSALMRLFFTIRLIHSALIALELETPYGWVKGGIGLLTATFVAGDTMMELSGG